MDEQGHEDNRTEHIEQLSELLSVVQVLACRLANESHGRTYDRAHELNEILHMARQQIAFMESELSTPVTDGIERRRSPRRRWAELSPKE